MQDSNTSNNGTAYLPKVSMNYWINLNLRLINTATYNYILLNGWQGDNWYELAPHLKILLDSCFTCDVTNITFHMTSSHIGVDFAELRVYQLDQAKPWGIWLAHYSQPAPSTFSLYYLNLTIADFLIFNNLEQVIFSFSNSMAINQFTPLRCDSFGTSMQGSGFCDSNCLTNGCDVC